MRKYRNIDIYHIIPNHVHSSSMIDPHKIRVSSTTQLLICSISVHNNMIEWWDLHDHRIFPQGTPLCYPLFCYVNIVCYTVVIPKISLLHPIHQCLSVPKPRWELLPAWNHPFGQRIHINSAFGGQGVLSVRRRVLGEVEEGLHHLLLPLQLVNVHVTIRSIITGQFSVQPWRHDLQVTNYMTSLNGFSHRSEIITCK